MILEKLAILKRLLEINENDLTQDDILNYYLDVAKNIICEIRFTTDVESIYINTQIRIALELYNKMGVEGQTLHTENGISRVYENSGISKSLLDEITPFVKTPFSLKRVIV